MSTTLEDIVIARIADVTDTPEHQLRFNSGFCRLLDAGCDMDYLIDWVMEAHYQGKFDN